MGLRERLSDQGRPIVVVGDSYAAGQGATSTRLGYPTVLAELLDAPVHAVAAGGCGFVSRGPKVGPWRRGAHIKRARQVPRQRRALVLQGSANDRDKPRDVIESAMHEFLDRVGDDGLVIITGAIYTATRQHQLDTVAEAGRRVADARGHAYVDVSEWFGRTPDPHWLAADGGHPSDEGHRVIAEHFAGVLNPLLTPGRQRE